MSEFAKETFPVSIDYEMQKSYLDYAMSVIVGRALPDVRDGLKPVHRRVLYSMNETSNVFNKPYKKSARVVGTIVGKYHPHGESSVYDALVRLAQDFSTKYLLVDGQGNFGSVDGDRAAAMRYTEVRMSKIANELLFDIDKETVNFHPNYDGTEKEPEVLPTKIPILLVNGSSGIAVGMATSIPPHNISEVIDGCLALLENEDININELIKFIPAPDFPTGGIIFGLSGVRKAYATGRGSVIIRSKTHIENIGKNKDREAIIIDEIPYQVNKAKLVEKIGYLVKDKIIEGISDLRDESDRSGMRVVIELKKNSPAKVILNQLFKLTPLQDSFGMNIIALVKGKPSQLNLKQILSEFLTHRIEVVTRRTIYELRKARDRSHILEGLATALSNVDEIIVLIKCSKSPQEAKEKLLSKSWKSSIVQGMLQNIDFKTLRPENLLDKYGLQENDYFLSEIQAQAILDLRLQRLTGLEQDKIISEYKEVLNKILTLIDILENKHKVLQIIKNEFIQIKEQYGDVRKSIIDNLGGELEDEDFIPSQEMVVTLSHFGYIKSQPVTEYQIQKRGGKGKLATITKDEDFIESLFIANTHDYLLCFTNFGRCYWIKVYKLPQGSRLSKGRPVNNVLKLQDNESISAILPTRQFASSEYVFMCTSLGYVKKIALASLSNIRSKGINVINLYNGENLIKAEKTSGADEIMLFSDLGKVVRFDERDVRVMGRSAHGVKGMKLTKNGKVISFIVINAIQDIDKLVLTVTENGFGTRSNINLYRKSKKKGGVGVLTIKTGARNGQVIGASLVSNNDELMLITSGGVLVRTKINQIRETGRTAQGVRLIDLQNNEKLVCIEKIVENNLESNDDNSST